MVNTATGDEAWQYRRGEKNFEVVLHMVVFHMVVLHMVGWCLLRHERLRLCLVLGVGDLDSGAEVNTLVLLCPKSTYRSAFFISSCKFL